MAKAATILLAGGGTGGHIFPNMAVAAAAQRMRPDTFAFYYIVSNRLLDAQLMQKHKLAYTALSAAPLIMRPKGVVRFIQGFRQAKREVEQTLTTLRPAAVIATGGFVSAPVMQVAGKAGIPVAMVNLDAVPGRANRVMARYASEVFTVYANAGLRLGHHIGMPLRETATASATPEHARQKLGLDANTPTLLITAGSQGATSINEAMIELTTRTRTQNMLRRWQVIHLTGAREVDRVREAYRKAAIPAVVEAFCHRMDLAWAAASLAISRAGAGSVAEVWAAAVPTIFLPYPFHKDQHQRYNAEPLVNRGAALLCTDEVDPIANANRLTGLLCDLMSNDQRREGMGRILADTWPGNGADALVSWLLSATGRMIRA